MEIILFIGSLICQLTGGVVLLINNILISPKCLGDEYCSSPRKEIMFDEKKEEILVENERLANILMNMYLNRIAFFYLVIGYGVNILGDIGNFNTGTAAVIIIACSILLAIASYKCVVLFAKRMANHDKYHQQVKDNVPVGTEVIVPYDENEL